MNRWVFSMARALAWAGGLVLVGMTAISVLSIGGRALSGFGLGPVPGDFELVEAGTALAVFCFLPWCHLSRTHATVDLFWNAIPALLQRGLSVLSQALMLAVWLLLTWRMGVSLGEYRDNGETTFILHMPVWWGYAASMVPAVLGLAVYLWTFFESLGWVQAPADAPIAAGGH